MSVDPPSLDVYANPLDRARLEQHAKNTHGKCNAYHCRDCGGSVHTIDADPGVTPFGIRCRACGGEAQSRLYRVGLDPDAVPWEWFRPDASALADLPAHLMQHVRQGGLLLRPRDPNERALYALPREGETAMRPAPGDVHAVVMICVACLLVQTDDGFTEGDDCPNCCDGAMRRMVLAWPAEPREGCTGVSARFCPRCGDCTCVRDDEDSTRALEGFACPLHGPDSKHAEDSTAGAWSAPTPRSHALRVALTLVLPEDDGDGLMCRVCSAHLTSPADRGAHDLNCPVPDAFDAVEVER